MLRRELAVQKEDGLTLVELMITLSVVALLLALTAPAMGSFFDKRKLIGATEDLFDLLQQARMESIARFQPIYVRFDDSNAAPGWQAGGSWQYGMSQTANCNPALSDNTATDACVVTVDNGDGTFNAGDDLVINRYTAEDYRGVVITAVDAMEVTFQPSNGFATPANITLQSPRGLQMRVMVTALGQASICSPIGAGIHVGGYKNC